MANLNIIDTILVLRHDDTQVWEQSGYCLQKGEIGIGYNADGSVLVKIGVDGKHVWNECPDVNMVERVRALAAEQELRDRIAALGNNTADLVAAETARATAAEEANANAIAAIVGNDVAKSMRTVAAEEAAKIVDAAPEALDTLKEVADWIHNDESGAAAMAATIGRHEVILGGFGDENQPASVIDYVTGEVNKINATIEQNETNNRNTYISKKQAYKTLEATKYDVSALPQGAFVTYKDTEIRVCCPENSVFTEQSVGPTGNPNMYYMTFRAYAPDNAVYFKEGDRGIIVDEKFDFNGPASGVDEFGRKYSVLWLALAQKTADGWNYFGKNSNEAKCLGWDYIVEWYDANDVLVGSDSVRINLTNENCHYTNAINVNRLVQTDGELLVLNCGNAQ